MRVLLAFIFLLIPAFGDTGSRFDWIEKLGSGKDTFVGLATDQIGNSYVVGNTSAADFPVKSPRQATLASPNAADIFIIKLDPSGNVIYSTYFGGSGDDLASALTVDLQGNLYVTGLTFSSNFPVTKGVFQPTVPALGPSGVKGSSFLLKLNADGTLGYSTYFAPLQSNPKAIAVDASGSVYITGTTTGGLPVNSGAYKSTCDCGFKSNGFFSVPSNDGFLARFDPTGSKLVYATYLNVISSIGMTIGTSVAVASDGSAYVGSSSGVYWFNATGTALLGHGLPKIQVNTMVIAPDRSLYLAGPETLGQDGFQPTAGAAQTNRNTVQPLGYQDRVTQQNAIVKMDGHLQNTLSATYFGGPYISSILSLALDKAGNLFVGGSTAPRGLPTIAPLALGFGPSTSGFAAELSGDLSTLQFSSYFGDAENFILQSVAPGADGSLILGGATVVSPGNPPQGAVWVNRVTVATPPTLRIDSVQNAASRLADPISGGETIVVVGAGFGSGSQVLINGTALTPIALSSRELTVIAPADLAGGVATVQVKSGDALSNSVLAPVAVVSPGLFSVDGSGAGQGYILNQDGTLNGPDHPAQPGDRITVFATGIGPLTFDHGYAVTATPVSVFIDQSYTRGVAAVLGPVAGFPGDVYQLTVYVPSYAELVAQNPDLHTFKFPPQIDVVLKIASRSSQNGLSISIAQ